MNKKTLNPMKLDDVIFEGLHRYEIGIVNMSNNHESIHTVQVHNIRSKYLVCFDFRELGKVFGEELPISFDSKTKVRLGTHFYFEIQNGEYCIVILKYKGPVKPKKAG
ncbi:hypothetical protein ERK14_07310 [Lactobacillus kunkeei]|nr:hypothetical protein [Apilactobacillus kunkeei]